MAYVAPTASDIKARYPEFEAVEDTLINLIIADAVVEVGESWLERDRRRAQMLWVAHTLTMEGEPGRTASGVGAAGTGQIKRDKVGDAETEFNVAAASSSGDLNGIYGGTAYGREFLSLMRRNFPAILAV